MSRTAPPRAPAFVAREVAVEIPADRVVLGADLLLVPGAPGIVVFAHGSGSDRRSPRNRSVAAGLNRAGLSTLLLDLLSEEEDREYAARFDLETMAPRLVAATEWVWRNPSTQGLRVGYFGASTGAAVALVAAAELGPRVHAVVARGGRPDLVGPGLARVDSPTLLVVGSRDEVVLGFNRYALAELGCSHKELAVVPGASHLFEEAGTLEQVTLHATRWFLEYLVPKVH